jgi:NAD(P)-dependent dehydrogenase (short-subunit alcohol dehydrogenase family)
MESAMSATRIKGATVLVTGASRGIGHAITRALLERGAARVYATARQPEDLSRLVKEYPERVIPLQLDVTDPVQVQATAVIAADVDILVNNAGAALGGWIESDALLANARQEMEVNYFAPLSLLQSFSPVLSRNGGGAVVNISSVAGLTSFPFFPTYSASKAAVHSLTQAARMLLAGQGTLSYGVYPGPVDTDMARDLDMEKATPASVADAILDGIEAGQEEIFTDPFARQFGEQFQASPKASERQVAAMVAGQG